MAAPENPSPLAPVRKHLAAAGLRVQKARERLRAVLQKPGDGICERASSSGISKLPLARLANGVRGTCGITDGSCPASTLELGKPRAVLRGLAWTGTTFAVHTTSKKPVDGPSASSAELKDGLGTRRVCARGNAPALKARKPKSTLNFGDRLRGGIRTHGAKLLAPLVVFGAFSAADKEQGAASGAVNLSDNAKKADVVEEKRTISGWGNFIAGFTAGSVAKTVVSPLEVSFRYIASSGASTNILKTVNMVVAEKGIGGLWAGNIANCIRNGPNKAIQFAIYSPMSNLIQKFQPEQELNVAQRALCGAISGVGATYVVYPLDLVSMRQSVSPPGTYRNMFHAFTKTVQQGGILSLYQGLGPSLLWVIPYYGVQFSSYDWVKAEYCKRTGCSPGELTTVHTLAFGSFAGAAACTATHPFEVIRRRLQVQGLDGGARQYKGVIDCVRKMYAADGLAAFGKGILSNNVRLIPATGVQFLVYEMCKDLLSTGA